MDSVLRRFDPVVADELAEFSYLEQHEIKVGGCYFLEVVAVCGFDEEAVITFSPISSMSEPRS